MTEGRLEIECHGLAGHKAFPTLDGELIKNCKRIELVIDAADIVHANIDVMPNVTVVKTDARVDFKFTDPNTGRELVYKE